jgi:hypothetical protein
VRAGDELTRWRRAGRCGIAEGPARTNRARRGGTSRCASPPICSDAARPRSNSAPDAASLATIGASGAALAITRRNRRTGSWRVASRPLPIRNLEGVDRHLDRRLRRLSVLVHGSFGARPAACSIGEGTPLAGVMHRGRRWPGRCPSGTPRPGHIQGSLGCRRGTIDVRLARRACRSRRVVRISGMLLITSARPAIRRLEIMGPGRRSGPRFPFPSTEVEPLSDPC